MICCNYCVDWSTIATGLSAIATFVMALIAFFSLLQNKIQFRDENRARLVFEIISYRNEFMLKIMNAGKSTAYDVQLSIKSSLIENHYSVSIKSVFEQISNTKLVMAPGRCIYILLTPAYTTKQSSYTIGDQTFTSDSVNKWLDEYKDEKIIITGKYCKKHKIKEAFSITDFLGLSAIVYDDNTIALQDIKKELGQSNDNGKSIITLLETIKNKCSDINKNENNNIKYE